jgi:hypothetical protein
MAIAVGVLSVLGVDIGVVASSPHHAVDQCKLPVAQRRGGWFCYPSSRQAFRNELLQRVATGEQLPQPVGDWRVAATGATNGTTWTIRLVVGNHDGECLSATTHPALGHIDVDYAVNGGGIDGNGPGPSYKGYPASCAPTPDASNQERGASFAVVLDADSLTQRGEGSHYIAGIISPAIVGMRAKLSDGTSIRVAVHDGVFYAEWTGAGRQVMTFTVRSPTEPFADCGGGQSGPLDDVSSIECSANSVP